MRYKVIYENNRGQRVNLSERPYFLNIEPILDYQWSYSEKEKRRGNIIAGFAKDIQSVDLTLHIMDANAEARDEAVDYFNNVIEADIYDGIAGRLLIGDWYTWGYIIASKNTKWQYGNPVVKKVVKLVREQENWYHVVQKANYGSEQAEELYNFVEEDIKTYEGADTNSLKSLTATINPKQDLHGYDKPWVGGGGKNKLPSGYATTQTKNGVTFTINEDGTVKANGTATATTVLYLSTYEDLWSSGSYILNGCPSGGGNNKYCLRMYATGGTTLVSDFGSGVTFMGQSQLECAIVIWNGQTVSNLVFEPMIRLASVSDATYSPYSNICPISGWDEVSTYVSLTISAEDGTTYTTDLPETVYGGTLDVVNGVLTVDRAMVDYPNMDTTSGTAVTGGWRCNFTCPSDDANRGKWSIQTGAEPILSMSDGSAPLSSGGVSKGYGANEYTIIVANATSKAEADTALKGLQLVYKLSTPQTYQLTPKQVTTLLGTNNVWADSGDVTVEYWDDAGRIKTASGSVATFSKHNSMSGAGYDYPYDYMADAQSQKRIENPNSVPCDFSITIQGYVDRPEVQIGDNVIAFDLEVPYGAFLTVDSSKKTAIMTLANGEQVNVFGARDPDYYLFERIKEGKNTVTWNGSFLWEIKMLEERSEPRWLMD